MDDTSSKQDQALWPDLSFYGVDAEKLWTAEMAVTAFNRLVQAVNQLRLECSGWTWTISPRTYQAVQMLGQGKKYKRARPRPRKSPARMSRYWRWKHDPVTYARYNPRPRDYYMELVRVE